MVDLIRRTQANGVVFISGDLHVGEISRGTFPGMYPLWDVTSSGLTQVWRSAVPNVHRVGPSVLERNFGLIIIDWNAPSPTLRLQLRAEDGTVRTEQVVPLSQLQVSG